MMEKARQVILKKKNVSDPSTPKFPFLGRETEKRNEKEKV
jgi:hypothetical protein